MKISVIVFGLLMLVSGLNAQEKQKYDTSFNKDYYKVKRELQEGMPMRKHSVVFLGNSITEHGLWYELFPKAHVYNRGIGGDICWGVFDRLDKIVDNEPSSIFLLIGINDIGRGYPVEMIANKYDEIVAKIITKSPKTKLVLQTVLPMNEAELKYDYMKGKGEAVKELNRLIKNIGTEHNVKVLDLYKWFADSDGQLPSKYTWDGLHLNSVGYLHWRKLLKNEVR